MIASPSARVRAAVVTALLALTAAACAQTPKPKPAPMATARPAPTGPVATPGLAPRDRLRKAIDLLGQGRRDQARAEVQQLILDQPANPAGRKLLDQIDMDPKVLLGERNYPYRVKPGETMSQLADRFLGDPILFYALARYNGIDAPAQTEAGRILLIPGAPKKAAPPRAAARAPGEAAPTAAAPAAAAARNPAKASQLRGLALEDMNSGAIDRAVARLRLALQLDPESALIKRELDRALRIHAAVRGQ